MNAAFETAADGFCRNVVSAFPHAIGNPFKRQIE